MTTPDVRSVLRVHGRLVAGPTNMALAFPYGGTALGLVRDAEFNPGVVVKHIEAEEYGGHSAEIILCKEQAVFACVLRGADNDAWKKVFYGCASGSAGHPKLTWSSGSGGAKLSTTGFKLLFAPTDEARNPFFLLYNAVAHPAETARMQLAVSREMGWGAKEITIFTM